MTPEHWHQLLSRWSAEILAVEAYRDALPPDVAVSGWLGFPGATPEEIARVEARLGIALPPSYRAFLAVTDGWRMTTPFIERVRPVGELAWYRDVEPEGLAAWLDGERWAHEHHGGAPAGRATGDGLWEALAISDYGDGIYLLIPRPTGPDGEWPAWFFAPWVPGERAHATFWELMVDEYETFQSLRDNRGQRR